MIEISRQPQRSLQSRKRLWTNLKIWIGLKAETLNKWLPNNKFLSRNNRHKIRGELLKRNKMRRSDRLWPKRLKRMPLCNRNCNSDRWKNQMFNLKTSLCSHNKNKQHHHRPWHPLILETMFQDHRMFLVKAATNAVRHKEVNMTTSRTSLGATRNTDPNITMMRRITMIQQNPNNSLKIDELKSDTNNLKFN